MSYQHNPFDLEAGQAPSAPLIYCRFNFLICGTYNKGSHHLQKKSDAAVLADCVNGWRVCFCCLAATGGFRSSDHSSCTIQTRSLPPCIIPHPSRLPDSSTQPRKRAVHPSKSTSTSI